MPKTSLTAQDQLLKCSCLYLSVNPDKADAVCDACKKKFNPVQLVKRMMEDMRASEQRIAELNTIVHRKEKTLNK